ETLLAMLDAFVPGELLGKVDEIHRARLDAAGFGEHRYAACGYSLGATYRPSWMDVPPMIYSDNPLVLQPGMVFFPHVMLGDADSGLAMGLGQSVLVTETRPEVLNKLPLELIVRD
ncbi:MAG: aminopeptidase P family protein, partial [Alphaproteobacteria bacterium]|nr:aminopeptidase P family protein [Alphaproteobacteria bacterium]